MGNFLINQIITILMITRTVIELHFTYQGDVNCRISIRFCQINLNAIELLRFDYQI